ncbi:MAG: peptide-methionine (R)-S-oxide reductase, partial [Bacteroidota bacterium]|nr:peptide-methionine (R)-S-oxide reductase [Bacteroidota bacterium]
PSFWSHIEGGVQFNKLTTYQRERTQLLCWHCGLHLGHLFSNKHTPTGLRYCINGASIQWEAPSVNNHPSSNTFMSLETLTVDQVMQAIRENRSSESNFATLQQILDKAIADSQQGGSESLTSNLQEVKEKYGAEFEKAKETRGTAWPEFEKFVTQFERALTEAKNGNEPS